MLKGEEEEEEFCDLMIYIQIGQETEGGLFSVLMQTFLVNLAQSTNKQTNKQTNKLTN